MYADPFGNLQPGSVPLPGSRPYDQPGNDYYFSGHTCSAVILCIMFVHNDWKILGVIAGLFVVYTIPVLLLHHGHYSHDCLIGFYIAFVFYKFWHVSLPFILYWGNTAILWAFNKCGLKYLTIENKRLLNLKNTASTAKISLTAEQETN